MIALNESKTPAHRVAALLTILVIAFTAGALLKSSTAQGLLAVRQVLQDAK
jgi:hypothetical protein